MEDILIGAFGQVFAVHDDVRAPLPPSTDVCMGCAEKGPVLLAECRPR